MKKRATAVCALLLMLTAPVCAQQEAFMKTMKRATQYMMDSLSCHGGFVWSYLPDHTRQWGEIEATPTMIWMQAPGTPDVGQLMLDAYAVTHDEYYYQCAQRVASAILDAQLPCGGWHYMHNYAPETDTRQWYNTIGRQAWRLEEFQHSYGNATFDDLASSSPANFLLRLYLTKHDKSYLAPLRKAIDFFIKSQYANGGWPQRYPLKADHPFKGNPDYTPFITINDDVLPANTAFLLKCYALLKMPQLKDNITRALELTLRLQQPEPLAGWADQYDEDNLLPAPARSYEPGAVNTGTTAEMIGQLIDYYKLTGDPKFLKGIPAAISFIRLEALPDSMARLATHRPMGANDILTARYINPSTGRPMFVHRMGSNVKNGRYYTNEDIRNTLAHYGSVCVIDTLELRRAYNEALSLNADSLRRHSPLLKPSNYKAEKYFYLNDDGSLRRARKWTYQTAEQLVRSLTPQGYWLTVLGQDSHPYKPIPEDMPDSSMETKYATTMVGDEYDTSCFPDNTKGISTRAFINNMTVLMAALTK